MRTDPFDEIDRFWAPEPVNPLDTPAETDVWSGNPDTDKYWSK